MHTPPPPVQMVQLLAGFQISQALYAAAKLGIPDQLAQQPQTAAELAERLQADPAATARLVRDLAGLGVFAAAGNRWELTPLGQTLVSDTPGSVRDLALMWMETHYAPFGRLLDTIRTGTPAADAYYGQPFFTWLSGHPEQVDRFTRAMANITEGIKVGAAATIDFAGIEHVVDVGGADGTLLAALLRQNPQLLGTTFDLPHVIADAAPRIKALGLEDRLQTAEGDFFADVPADADCYLLSMILHDWDDAHARQILANIARAARPGASVYSLELVLPPGDSPHMATMIDLTMLGMLTGRERTEAELRELVESAGLHFDGVTASQTPMSVLRARVPADGA
jgi:hypothetical protein